MPTKFIFAHCMSQINWYSEISIILPAMFRYEQNTFPDNTNMSLSFNCLNVFEQFVWSVLIGLSSLISL